MNDAEILKKLQTSADKMGACEPRWLRKNRLPKYVVDSRGDSGPEMLLLHGLFGAMSNWESTAPIMSQFAKVHALDFPLLTAHRSEVKVKSLAAFTEGFLRKEKMGKAVLCGNSLGGHVALRLCLAAPELVDCMVLSGTSGLYEHSVDSLPVRIGESFVREHMKRVFFKEDLVTDQAVKEVVSILSNRLNTLNLIHAARSAKKDNLLEFLKEIEVPTLLLWGEDDHITTMEVAKIFHKNIKNSELVTIKNCGHAPMIEHPEWFASETEKFLKKHSAFYKNDG